MVVYWQQRRNFYQPQALGERHGRAFCRGAERKNAGDIFVNFEARVVATSPPAIQGLGSFSGFSFILEDQSNTIDTLSRESVNCARQSTPRIASCVYDFAANAPQLQVEIDRNKAGACKSP